MATCWLHSGLLATNKEHLKCFMNNALNCDIKTDYMTSELLKGATTGLVYL